MKPREDVACILHAPCHYCVILTVTLWG